jgi:hypothetical protein
LPVSIDGVRASNYLFKDDSSSESSSEDEEQIKKQE